MIRRKTCVLAIIISLSLSACKQINLFDTGFMPHGYCLRWDPALMPAMVFANLGIALAYFAIPAALWYFVRHKKDLPYPWMFRLFGMFIIACGLTHIMQVWTLYQPHYWLAVGIDIYTAIISLITAVALWPLIPKALTLKSPKTVDEANQQKNKTLEYFHVLVDNIQDYAIFMLDPHGTILTWNEGAERIKGYTAKEVIGQNYSMFFPNEERKKNRPRRNLELAKKAGRYEEEALRLRKDGSQFWADIILTPLFDQSGELTGFAKITRDISERKLAMNLLQEQADLLELASDAIIVRDINGAIQYWNHGAEIMYGYTKEQATHKISHDLLKTIHPKPLAEIDQELLTKGHWNGELIHTRHNGQKIIIYTRHVLKTDIEGNVSGILELNTDITLRKEAEQKQLALVTMQRVNAELEQFASVASHDLQEPLRAITGCLQILEKTYKDKLDSNGEELIRLAIDGAHRMRALISDLLLLSRVDSEQMTLTAVDLNKVIDQVKKDLSSAIEESHAEITYANLPVIQANATLLTQLFLNLISNAIKFHGDQPPKIFINVKRRNGEYEFDISDNGIGFEQPYAERIFEPFKRLHSRDKYPGTGIGLPICKRIVERHGGKIWVESKPGSGTTFHFTIADRGDGND